MSVVITLSILVALLLVGPASAVKLFLHSPSDVAPHVGEIVMFFADIDLELDEVMPFKTVSLEVNGIECMFPLLGGVTLSIEQACQGFLLEPLEEAAFFHLDKANLWAYGYGMFYGYGQPNIVTDVRFDSGYGYGYFYGYGYENKLKGISELAYKVTWLTDNYDPGLYVFRFFATASQGDDWFQFKTKNPLEIHLLSGGGNPPPEDNGTGGNETNGNASTDSGSGDITVTGSSRVLSGGSGGGGGGGSLLPDVQLLSKSVDNDVVSPLVLEEETGSSEYQTGSGSESLEADSPEEQEESTTILAAGVTGAATGTVGMATSTALGVVIALIMGMLLALTLWKYW